MSSVKMLHISGISPVVHSRPLTIRHPTVGMRVPVVMVPPALEAFAMNFTRLGMCLAMCLLIFTGRESFSTTPALGCFLVTAVGTTCWHDNLSVRRIVYGKVVGVGYIGWHYNLAGGCIVYCNIIAVGRTWWHGNLASRCIMYAEVVVVPCMICTDKLVSVRSAMMIIIRSIVVSMLGPIVCNRAGFDEGIIGIAVGCVIVSIVVPFGFVTSAMVLPVAPIMTFSTALYSTEFAGLTVFRRLLAAACACWHVDCAVVVNCNVIAATNIRRYDNSAFVANSRYMLTNYSSVGEIL